MSAHVATGNVSPLRGPFAFGLMAIALVAVGFIQSPTVSVSLLNLCLISAIMAIGVNIQWGYAGLFNVGTMGFAALGGVGAVLTAQPPVPEAWGAGGMGLGLSLLALIGTVIAVMVARAKLTRGRTLATVVLSLAGYALVRQLYDPATDAIEAVNPAQTGYLGGLGLPIVFGWIVGALLAAGAAWIVGKISLGLRSDYLAIATLGISEIIIAVVKNEDWLVRGVKNVTGLPRPVPYEVDLQQADWFVKAAADWGLEPAMASSLYVRGLYAILFLVVLLILVWLAERALSSPWGRMMRAIRDNEDAAEAMGKDVTKRHLEIFVIGSAVVGLAGAMLTTLEGQYTPGAYNPLRFTFLIWVMVIVGGSGNTWGGVLGGFLIWFLWVEAEPAGRALMEGLAGVFPDGSAVAAHLTDGAPHMRMIFMGLILLFALRLAPRGILPEKER
ncbi:branched-chain amino acid ABC transporter permease [Rhodovulum sp. DZ06]|uniref:branched-chain amino acid ABC transporter permease n=1 Tax=Rhodovulum sp. DZ06 TaxID=3425126 RepID=UPI003D3358F1